MNICSSRTAEERIDAKSSIVPFCGCRLWFGATVPPMGYGVMSYDGRQQYVHRVAWQLANGAIPDGALVLHRCDMPACSNPRHLFLGTAKDNVRDMMQKGRARMAPPTGDRNPMRLHKGLLAGERSPSARLSQSQVAAIRAAYAAGSKQAQLATAYGVTQCHISRIVRGASWAH